MTLPAYVRDSDRQNGLNVPIGTLTPTNVPFCSAGPTEGTVFPRTMPTAMAMTIHSTRNRSRNERPLSGGRSALPSSARCQSTLFKDASNLTKPTPFRGASDTLFHVFFLETLLISVLLRNCYSFNRIHCPHLHVPDHALVLQPLRPNLCVPVCVPTSRLTNQI